MSRTKAVATTNIKIEVVEVEKKSRKPKTSKVVVAKEQEEPLNNVILHLKCSSKDLNEYVQKNNSIASITYMPEVPNIMTYNAIKDENYAAYDSAKPINNNAYESNDFVCKVCKQTNEDDSEVSLKDINAKLKKLKVQLFKNSLIDKKSACFWCTFEYDNPTCYIPKYETDSSIMAYGSFCRPECAVAYLLKENLDDSTKFERYQLLNQIYGKIYDYKRNIKPAPNPYYTLDKFYGTLSIQEYRKLLKTDHMLITIEKPMTRALPELHEETDETILNVGKTTTGTFKVKRQSEKTAGPTKASLLMSAFGLTA